MDSSFENQTEAGIQGARQATQNAFNATASNAFSTLKGVEHDITMISGGAFAGNIGKTAVQIGVNLGKLDGAEGSVASTYLKEGMTGLIKRGARNLLGKSTDASSGANVGTDGTTQISNTTDITVQNPLFEDADTFADASTNLASSQAGNASSAPASLAQGELVGGDEDAVGARMGAETGTEASTSAETGTGTSSSVVATATEETATGADALSDTLATAAAGSSIFDEVPVAGLAITGVLAIGSELASIFESKSAQQINKVGVQASNAAGFTTL